MNTNKFGLLDQIKYPADLRKLKLEQLPEVCKELREDIIHEVSVNPGHFASSFGNCRDYHCIDIMSLIRPRIASFGMSVIRLMVIRFLLEDVTNSIQTGS